MTQPNKPGPSWEKEADTQAEKDIGECTTNGNAGVTLYATDLWRLEKRRWLQGARWAQEKGVMEMSPEESKKHNDAMLSFFGDEKAAAPGEESWEKLRDLEAEKYISDQYPLGKTRPEFNREDGFEVTAFSSGFDAAVSLIALPLRAELKIQDDANDILTRQCDELKAEAASICSDALAIISAVMPTPVEGYKQNPSFLLSDLRRLVSEAASLRAENELLQKRNGLVEKVCSGEFGYDALSKDNATLRAQLAEAITTLELIAGPVEFYCEIGERNKQSAAQATLAKLKAGREEG